MVVRTPQDDDENRDTVNRHIDAVVQNLTKGLTFSENFLGGFVDYPMTGPVTAEASIATGLSTAPLAVLCVGLWRTQPTRAAVPLAAPFAWDFNTGNITTSSFVGLASGASYTARLLVIQR